MSSSRLPETETPRTSENADLLGRGVSAVPEADQPDWFHGNVLNPLLNAAVIEPYKAVSGVVNGAGEKAGVRPMAPVDRLAVSHERMMSPGWMVQTVVSGLATAVPYAIAGKIMGTAFRAYGCARGVKGTTAAVLQNTHFAQIAGAGAYDFLREPLPGETRFGNAAGGLVGFGIFEAGNSFSARLSLPGKIAARSTTGFTGAMAQFTTAHLISTGEMADADMLLQAGVSGAFMNLALPATQRGISKAADWANVRLGRGVPLDRYLAEQQGWQSGSPELAALAAEHPWARVQPGEVNAARGSRAIEVQSADPAKLGHELLHLTQARSAEAQFAAIAAKVQDGRVGEARQDYFALRRSQEEAAVRTENAINEQLGRDTAPNTGRIDDRTASNGKKYFDIWQEEFERFKQSGGTYRPEETFARSGHKPRTAQEEAALWQHRVTNWTRLQPSERLEVLTELRAQKPAVQMSIWNLAIKDPDNHVRFAAAEAIAQLPQSRRSNAFLTAMRQSDYPTRLIVLSTFESIPAAERFDVFKSTLAQARTTLRRPGHGQPNEASSLSYDAAYKPYHERLKQTPEDLLVQAIQSMPRSGRNEAWTQAFDAAQTRQAAAQNLVVVPEPQRFQAWQRVFRSGGEGHVKNSLAQLELLTPDERLTAWEEVKNKDGALRQSDRQQLTAAFKALSLSDAEKFGEWRLLLDRLKEHDAERSDHGTGYGGGWYAPRRPVSSYFPPMQKTALVAAIEGLPEAHRTEAFHMAFDTYGTLMPAEFTGLVRHLPAGDRVAAWGRVFDASPQGNFIAWHLASSEVPIADLPALAGTLLRSQFAEGPARAEFVSEFPFFKLMDLPLEERISASEHILRIGLAEAKPHDFEALRSWWSELPDKYDEATYTQERHVREHLANSLPPTELAKLLFNVEDAQLGQEFAQRNPDIIRKMMSELAWTGDRESSLDLAAAARAWNETGSLELAVVKGIEASPPRTESYAEQSRLPQLIGHLSEGASALDRVQALRRLSSMLLSTENSEFSVETAVGAAVRIGAADHATLQTHFVEPLQTALRDPQRDYSWRLRTARAVASAARQNVLGDVQITLPQLRMPAPELPHHQRDVYREQAEAALLGESSLPGLLGDGPLGRTFPTAFGYFDTEGGIVGRPQHGGHQFAVDDHTMRVIDRVRQHPDFDRLSRKDRVNLLWAALMHDVGKRAGRVDPDHEWAGANIAWGVLRGLGYSNNRTARIANLISRHSDASYAPGKTSSRFEDPAAAADLATLYRHPTALTQLRIFNESDIRSIDGESKYWTAEVQEDLNRTTSILNDHVRRLNQNAIPILTSELPGRFGLFPMQGDYAVLAHASSYMDSSFLHQLSVIETSEYSVSTSLLTPRHHELYFDTPIVALMGGPSEQISQAHRKNLGTGTAVDWKGHVKLSSEWVESDRAHEFAQEVDTRVRTRGSGIERITLAQLRKRLSQFESLDEVGRTLGPRSAEYRGAVEVTRALTTDASGAPLKQHNEIKLNNPTLEGIGIIRRGQPVWLENFPISELPALAPDGQIPAWLATVPSTKNVIVPQTVWQEAVRRNLPLMVLDP